MVWLFSSKFARRNWSSFPPDVWVQFHSPYAGLTRLAHSQGATLAKKKKKKKDPNFPLSPHLHMQQACNLKNQKSHELAFPRRAVVPDKIRPSIEDSAFPFARAPTVHSGDGTHKLCFNVYEFSTSIPGFLKTTVPFMYSNPFVGGWIPAERRCFRTEAKLGGLTALFERRSRFTRTHTKREQLRI